jgi:hypothetical protein
MPIVVPPQPHSIAQATADALSRLSTLSEDAQRYAGSEHINSAAAGRYSDENERLKIWAYEHDVESGGLEHKLRDNSVLRKRVLSLLEQLSGTTDTTRSDGGGDEETGRNAGLETLLTGTPVHLLLDVEDDDATSLSLDTNCTLPNSLSDSPLTHIHDVVNLLFGLGPTLLDPVPRDRFEWSAHEDAAHYDVGHVQARFPQADKSLIERLGRASWERRQYLIRLRSKLIENNDAPGLDHTSLDDNRLINLRIESSASDSGDDTSSDDASDVDEVYAATLQAHGSDPEADTSAPGPLTVIVSDGPSESRSSINDAQSATVTETPKGVSQHRPTSSRYAIPVPPHPNERFGGDEFLCPFCAHKVSDMKSAGDWKSVHLFLKPSIWPRSDMSVCIDTCTGNTSSKIWNRTCARTKIVWFRQRLTEAGKLGGSMRRSVIGHDAPGYVHHVSEDASNQSSILQPRSRRMSAITTLLDLREYRCPSSEICARKTLVRNHLVISALCATRSS